MSPRIGASTGRIDSTPAPLSTAPTRSASSETPEAERGAVVVPGPRDAFIHGRLPSDPARVQGADAVRDRFWSRADILRVRVRGLPASVDPRTLRDGRGLTLDDVTTTAWFGGPNSESTQRFSELDAAGAKHLVEWRGQTGVAISGNTSLWDACPTWRLALPPDAGPRGLIPGGKWKLAQNNRDFSSGMRRQLAGELFRLAGVPIGRARPAEVTLHFGDRAAYQGVRTFVETKSSMLENLFPSNTKGSHYELNWPPEGPANFLLSAGESGLEHLTRRPRTYAIAHLGEGRAPYADLAKFVDALHHLAPDAPARVADFESVFDVRGFLRELAVAVAIGNWDGYLDTPSNAELYNVGGNGRDYFVLIPNDTDNTFGISYQKRDGEFINWAKPNVFAPHETNPGGPQVPLIEKTLAVPQYRQYYADFLEHFVDHIYTERAVSSWLGTDDDGASGRGFWPVIKDAAYREGRFDEAPRTRRWATNDQLRRHGVQHEEYVDEKRRVFGIRHHTIMARGHIKHEIAKYREAGHPRVHTTFDVPYRPVTPPAGPAPEPRIEEARA